MLETHIQHVGNAFSISGYEFIRRHMHKQPWIVPILLLVALLSAPALSVSLPYLDHVGSYLMVAAAVALVGIVGWKMKKR
jgi:hypothetical protein